MAGFVKPANASINVSRAKRFIDEDCDDTEFLIFLSDLKSALNNLGGNLTIKEIQVLVRGIREDKKEGIPYDDALSALIFASFFIATFDRNGSGSITANELNEVMSILKKQTPFESNITNRHKEVEHCKSSGGYQRSGSERSLDYTKFTETIETIR